MAQYAKKKSKKDPQAQCITQCLIEAEATLQQEIQDAKVNYESQLIHSFATSRDPKLFHHLKSLSKSNFLPPCMFSDTNKAEYDLNKANLLNKYFYSVFTCSPYILPSIEDLPTHQNPFTAIYC